MTTLATEQAIRRHAENARKIITPDEIDATSVNITSVDDSGETELTIRCPLSDDIYCQQTEYGDTRVSPLAGGGRLYSRVVNAYPDLSNDNRVDAVIQVRTWIDNYNNITSIANSSTDYDRDGRITADQIKVAYRSLTRNLSFTSSSSSTDYSSLWTDSTNTSATYCNSFSEHIRYWTGRGKGATRLDPASRLREIMRHRKSPAIHSRNTSPGPARTPAEARARQTLRLMIGDKAYRKYLAKGFVIVYGASGRVYQVFPGMRHTKVWLQGDRIEDLCAILPSQFAPTDSIIMRICIIEQSEELFREKAIKHRAHDVSYAPYHHRDSKLLVPGINDVKQASLPEIFDKLKGENKVVAA